MLTYHSIHGHSKSLEDTESVIQAILPSAFSTEKSYRIAYAIHEIIPSVNPIDKPPKTRFIGLVNLYSPPPAGSTPGGLILPPSLALPPTASSTPILTLELAYSFLPSSWGSGFATEAVSAVLYACKQENAKRFWTPFEKVYVRAIVNGANSASLKVVRKVGLVERGVYEWTGRIWLAGGWRTKDDLHIWGGYLVE